MAMTDAKLQPWGVVQEQMNTIVKTTDPQDNLVMVPYGLQLAHSMRHPHVVRCLAFYHTTAGDTYVTHIDKGYTNEVNVWTISSLNETEMKCVRFPIKSSVSKLIYVLQHRVFVGFCTDMTLHVFSDVIHHCTDLTQTSCPATILCMVYIEDTDELITGGHGCLQAWKMTHAELREPLAPSRPIDCQVTSADWVREMRIDRKQHHLVALCDEGVVIINYITNKQIQYIRNWHQTALTSCVFYRRLEYFITASMDGAIKVWNAVVFSQVHEFIGHYNCVTGLATHPSDPLLISSSKDGTVRVWRLDTFELTQRLDVGEKILGMRLANSNQLYYYTLHDVKVWNFNLFHHMFTPIQSCVHKLARVKTPRTPSRILCAAEDGGVRLISAVTGAILTIIYPMATYQVLTDIVYDPKNESIYTVLATGDVLVFNTSSNPCIATQLWVPAAMPDDFVLCLALVKLDCALGRAESEYSQSLIFAGHSSGQITLLEASRYYMKIPIQAHCGLITGLEYSHGWYHKGVRKIGGADRLISYGSDKRVRVWALEISPQNSAEVGLVCLKTIVCDLCPTHVSMLGNVLCTVLPNKTVHMYQLLQDPNKSRRSSVGMGSVLGSSTTGYIKRFTHLKDHDHTQKITALCSCPSMYLFATTSNDGSVKIWDLTNTLVRELCFDHTLRSVCFANDRGDLIVGFQNHISYVTVTTYLPVGIMEEAVAMEFDDEEKEEPLKFNPDLRLWFDLDSLPTYPAELLHRRQLQQSVHNIRKYSLRYRAMSMAEEKPSVESPSADSLSSDAGIASSLESESSDEELALMLSEVKPHPPVAMDNVPKGDEDVDSGRGESPLHLEEEIPEEREDETAKVEEETKKEMKKVNRFPIAPDGYIPNSVIRAIIGYKPPPTPPTSPWKLKPVPEAAASPSKRSLAGSDVSYGQHEPFTWATSEEEEEDTYVSSYSIGGRLSTIPGSVTPSHAEETEESKKKGRRFSHLPTPGKIEIPNWEEEERSSKKGKKKKRRKSKQINVAEVKTFKKLAKEEEVSDDFEEDEDMGQAVPELLQRIAQNGWFPKRVILDVENVTWALLDLLNQIPILQFKLVCEALLEIHRELGMDQILLDSVISKLTEQLKSTRAIARANAVKTLASLGLCRKNIIMCLLIPMADDDDAVRQEAMEAVARLAGIKSRTGLMNYLDTIGMLPEYHHQEREVIQELKDRYTSSPSHRPMIRQSLISLISRRQHQLRQQKQQAAAGSSEEGELDVERLFPLGEELPLTSPTDVIQMWFSENSMDIGVTPISDEEDFSPWSDAVSGKDHVKTQKELRQEKIKERHKKRPSERKARPRRHATREEAPGSGSSEGSGFNVLTAEEAEEALDQFEEAQRLSDGSVGQPQILSDRSLGSTDQSGSMELSGSFGSSSTRSSERRRTIHLDMLELRAAMLAKEKESLVADMKEKLRKHRERYKQTMGQSRRHVKRLLPGNASFYRYYSQRDKLETKYEETSTETSSDNMSPSQDESPFQPKEVPKTYQTSEGIQSESGVGASYYESSCVFTDTDTKTGGQTSSGFITEQESIMQEIVTTRPKSSLTVENVQRFEARSAKGTRKKKQKKMKTEGEVKLKKERKVPKNWKELYLQPLLMHPSEHDKKSESTGHKTKFPPIKCIPSKVKLVAGETDERLLHSIAIGSQEELEEESQNLLLSRNRDFGTTQFGKLQFTWTTQTTPEEIKIQDSGDRKKVSMATSKGSDSSSRKLWLQQHLLFPSLCRLRMLDESKRQCAMMRRLHQKSFHESEKDRVIYKWDVPQPLVCPHPPSNINYLKEVEKCCQWKKYNNGDKRTPIRSKHYHLPYLQLNLPAPEPPIVPRNSTVSHQGNVLLPKLLDSDGQAIDNDVQSLCEETPVQ